MVNLLTTLLLLVPALLTFAKPVTYNVRYTNGTSTTATGKRATFHNPAKPGGGADPWVLRYGDYYYLTYTTGGDVRVTRSNNLAQWAETGTVVYTPSGGEADIWAPELHEWNGQLYIYVAMDHGSNDGHRMYVLQGSDPKNPLAKFNKVGQVTSPDNNWAIDGTLLKYTNGKLYFIWSGWTDSSHGNTQNLYIAPMDSPTHISGNRVLLHEPTPSWQKSYLNNNLMGINEGPEILVNNGRTFLLYSAAGSWSKDYCIAMMGIDGGKDPLVRSNWWTLDDRPVMWSSDVAFGPGHASFPQDRNGQYWVVYHADADPNAGWGGRTIRAQPMKFNADSSPWLPVPVGLNTELTLPA